MVAEVNPNELVPASSSKRTQYRVVSVVNDPFEFETVLNETLDALRATSTEDCTCIVEAPQWQVAITDEQRLYTALIPYRYVESDAARRRRVEAELAARYQPTAEDYAAWEWGRKL